MREVSSETDLEHPTIWRSATWEVSSETDLERPPIWRGATRRPSSRPLSPLPLSIFMAPLPFLLIMEFELHPSVTLESGTFSVVTAPGELVLRGLNGTPALSRFLFLYVCGNYSRLLTGIHRRSAQFEVRRAFTLFQLLTILREAHHTIIFVEHDPSLYEDAGTRSRGAPSRGQRGPFPPEQEEPLCASSPLDGPGMDPRGPNPRDSPGSLRSRVSLQDPGYLLPEVAGALAEAARTAAVVLYAPRQDPTLSILARRADRVFCLEAGEKGLRAARIGRGGLPPGGDQTTLEVFGWAAPSRA